MAIICLAMQRRLLQVQVIRLSKWPTLRATLNFYTTNILGGKPLPPTSPHPACRYSVLSEYVYESRLFAANTTCSAVN